MAHGFTTIAIHITNSSSIATKVSQCLSALKDDSKLDDTPRINHEKLPRVVSLTSATPSAASKVISIAEIVKRRLGEEHEVNAEVTEPGGGGGGGRRTWWQYTKLTSVTVPWPPPPQPITQGKSKRKASERGEGSGQYPETTMTTIGSKRVRQSKAKSTNTASTGRGNSEGDENEGVSDGGEEFSFFENQTKDISVPQKIRALPVLTIYLSRQPVEQLSKHQ